MADSRKTNFTYRVNTKTPTEVEEWLATKPDELSYPEFVNAAIMVARSKDDDSDLDLDSITNSLAEMVAKQAAVPARPSGGSGVSPEEVGMAISPVIERDGEATRQHIDEVAGQLSERIESLAIPSEPSSPEGTHLTGENPVPAAPDYERIAGALATSVSESVLPEMSTVVSADGERTRQSVGDLMESVGRVGEGVSSILEIIQSSGDETGEPVADTSVNVIPDGQLTEDDLNFAVQRIKDTIRTDGQKTRNAIIDKIEKSIPEGDSEPFQQGLTSEDMQAICDLIKQSNQAMIESLEQKVAAIQQAEAQGSGNIVFDEETTSFFKRIHNSVASILIRVDAMQAQLEHIQRMVERNGSTIRTMSRAVTQDDGRVVLPGGNQFGDALAFASAPEIEDLESAGKWTGKEGWMPSVSTDDEGQAPEADDAAEDVMPTDGDAVQFHDGPEENLPDATEEASARPQVPYEDGIDLSSPEAVLGSLLDGLMAPEMTDEEKPGKRQRVAVPQRRRSRFAADAASQEPDETPDGDSQEAEEEAPSDESDGTIVPDGDFADDDADDDIMQPTGRIPEASPSAESVESIIDGLDFNSVATVASDPDELLTDTLQSLLG